MVAVASHHEPGVLLDPREANAEPKSGQTPSAVSCARPRSPQLFFRDGKWFWICPRVTSSSSMTSTRSSAPTRAT